METILLIGKGHLGTFLSGRLKIPSSMHWRDEMSSLTAQELRSKQPTVVVNCAGKTDLKWCEDNPKECFKSNVEAPLAVYRAVREAFPSGTVPYIHLSSGCVWDGPYKPDGKAFSPIDPPSPACFYSWTKAACDALLMAEAAPLQAPPLLILRPRQVYSPLPSPRNMLSKLCLYEKLLQTPNSITSAETIAKTIEIMPLHVRGIWARKYGTSPLVMNVYDRGITSPWDVATWLWKAGCRENWPEVIMKAELDAWHKPKRVDTVLHDSLFEQLIGPPRVHDEMIRVIFDYAKTVIAPSPKVLAES
jgi:dTDP-4-dehydrorhamnose reductase